MGRNMPCIARELENTISVSSQWLAATPPDDPLASLSGSAKSPNASQAAGHRFVRKLRRPSGAMSSNDSRRLWQSIRHCLKPEQPSLTICSKFTQSSETREPFKLFAFHHQKLIDLPHPPHNICSLALVDVLELFCGHHAFPDDTVGPDVNGGHNVNGCVDRLTGCPFRGLNDEHLPLLDCLLLCRQSCEATRRGPVRGWRGWKVCGRSTLLEYRRVCWWLPAVRGRHAYDLAAGHEHELPYAVAELRGQREEWTASVWHNVVEYLVCAARSLAPD